MKRRIKLTESALQRIIRESVKRILNEDYRDTLSYELIHDKYRGYNYKLPNGKLLSKVWFRYAKPFNGGFAYVQQDNGRWAILDEDGIVHYD